MLGTFGHDLWLWRCYAAGIGQCCAVVFLSVCNIDWCFAQLDLYLLHKLFNRSDLLGDSYRFAGLSLWGYTTKRDISGWGSFLMMGVIGILVAMIINIFLGSPAIMFAISILGVLIFAGPTAYDTQNIKNTYLAHAHHGDQEWLDKSAIHGALNLYLDF